MFKRIFQLIPPRPAPVPDTLQVGARVVPLLFVPNPQARRYLLRLRPDGVARVTVPRSGTLTAARAFATRNIPWLEQQFERLARQPAAHAPWEAGTTVYFRGEPVPLEVTDGWVRLGPERIPVPDPTADLRPVIQRHLRRLAAQELPVRVAGLAALHGIEVSRVTVRNQKSRWGSCSRRGTISLNWRLVQTPPWVCDYIILHELAHRRQMNHSDRFWAEVARLCPDYEGAEKWLRQHAQRLRQE